MSKQTYVWDPLVRVFHWSLVLTFTIAYFTGDEESTLHVYSGYIVMGLIGIRIIWGLVGPRYARFSDFITSPAAVLDYLKGFIGKGSGRHYLGHNPAGGWMVIALMISILATGVSGLKVYGLEGHGPLAESTVGASVQPISGLIKTSADEYDDEHEYEKSETADHDEEFWEEIHEFLANFTVFLVLLHIGGVIASSLKQRQNLAKSMITGYKREDE